MHRQLCRYRDRQKSDYFLATGSTNFLVEDKPLPIPSFLSTYVSWTSYSLPIADITFFHSFNEAYTPTSSTHSPFFYESTSSSFTQSLCCLTFFIPSVSDMPSFCLLLLLSSCRTPAMPVSLYLQIKFSWGWGSAMGLVPYWFIQLILIQPVPCSGFCWTVVKMAFREYNSNNYKNVTTGECCLKTSHCLFRCKSISWHHEATQRAHQLLATARWMGRLLELMWQLRFKARNSITCVQTFGAHFYVIISPDPENDNDQLCIF